MSLSNKNQSCKNKQQLDEEYKQKKPIKTDHNDI